MQQQRPVAIWVLGPLTMLIGDEPVHLGGPRQRAVFAQLVVRANLPVPIGELAHAVWGDTPPASVGTTLRGYVKHLRRALAGTEASIVTAGGAYRLDVDAGLVDAVRFEREVMAARRDLGGEGAAHLAQRLGTALSLWRGEAYADVSGSERIEQEAARLSGLRLLAVETEIESQLLAGAAAAVVPRLEALQREHPLHEGFCAQLMRAWASCGRRADALRAYGDLHRRLAVELGVEPSSAIREVELQILGGTTAGPPSLVALHSLPVDPTPFVGRRADVQRVVDALAESRLTTITGAGGIGKTRLAIAVAQITVGPPVIFIELASLATGDEVSLAFAAALQVAAPAELLTDALVAALAGRTVLLLVDNCEHVVDAAAALVHALLLRCPNLRVLATSREPLAVAEEHVVKLGGLSLPGGATAAEVLASDAGRMFADRARATTGFAIDDGNAASVVEVCAAFDGLPLAIELAVPALRALTVQQLAAALEDHDALLIPWSVPRCGPERHRALTAAIDWSFQLLTPHEQRLLCLLSVFPDRFGLDDAGAVCSPEIPLFETLAGLVGKSVVTRIEDATPAFRLLVPVRSFATRGLAASDEVDEARGRHARHFLDEAERVGALLHGEDAVVAHARLDACRDDLRQALAWFLHARSGTEAGRLASVLWPHWDCRFEIRYGLESICTILGLEVERSVRLQLLVGATHLAWLADDLTLGLSFVDEGLALAGDGDFQERGRLMVTAGDIRRAMNEDPDQLEALSTAAAQLLCVAEDTWWEASALRLSALVALDRGEVDRSIRCARRALELWETCSDIECIGGSHLLLAHAFLDTGVVTEARWHGERALAGFRTVNEPTGVSSSLGLLALAALTERDLDVASEMAARALEEASRVGFSRGFAGTVKVQADIAFHAGRLEEAEALASEALRLFRPRGFTGDTITAFHTLAAIAVQRRESRRAIKLCVEALRASETSGHRRLVSGLLRLLGIVRAREGEVELADELCREALRLAQAVGNHRGIAECLVARAEVAIEAGALDHAVDQLAAGMVITTKGRLTLSPLEVAHRDGLLEVVRRGAGQGRVDVFDRIAALAP